MLRLELCTLVLTWLAITGTASAQEPGGEEPAPVVPEPAHHEPPGAEDRLDHRLQVGLRIGAGMPFIFGVKYADGPNCDVSGENFCRDFGTPLLDVELGFGVTEKAEVSISGRFGLTESDVSRSHPIQLGVGIRGYGTPFDPFKVFFGGRLILDVTSSSVPNWSDVDFGVRGEFGLQYDFLRYLGAYAQLGASISFIRAFSVTIDLTAGVQVRFP
jgi:hypothetical protein